MRGFCILAWVPQQTIEEYHLETCWEEESLRGFPRPGRRTILTWTVIAVGFAAVTTLAAWASPRVTDTTRVIRLSGHNIKKLPPFRVAAPSTLSWTNSGPIFQIWSHDGYCFDGAVASQAHRGTTYLPAGRYDQLRVSALGNWTITIRTGVEKIPTPIRFTGSGGKELPPFRLRSGKTMYWTNSGALFQTFSSGPTIKGIISSPAHRGSKRLPAGRYRLYVNAAAPEGPMGTWTIVIR